jgi:hypothetical protein
MSLFENDQYRWRETYFVLFDEKRLPTVASMKRCSWKPWEIAWSLSRSVPMNRSSSNR